MKTIFEYKIFDKITVMAFGQPTSMIVIGFCKRTNQLKLKNTDGVGSSYWSLGKINEHTNRVNEFINKF